MPVIMKEVSVAAGATNENIFSGSAFEFARGPVLVSVAAVQSATGCFAALQSGGDIIAEEFSLPIKTTYPIIPDEFFFSDVATTGDRLVLRVRNPTGGALTIRAIAQVTPL